MADFQINMAANFVGKMVKVKGWIRHIRSSGSIYFIEVRDGYGEIQCVVVKSEVDERLFKECAELKLESSLVVEGLLREEKELQGDMKFLLRIYKLLIFLMRSIPYPRNLMG